MDKETLINLLNSSFPPLDPWHEWLLAAALVVAVASALELTTSGWGGWGVVPGLLMLRLVWRQVPPPGRERAWWILTTTFFSLIVTGTALIGVVRLLN